MALKINKKQERKIEKKYTRILDELLLMHPERTEDNFILWCSGIDFESKQIRKIVNAKKGELNSHKKNFNGKAYVYIETVLRNAWRKHWANYYDKLSQEKQN